MGHKPCLHIGRDPQGKDLRIRFKVLKIYHMNSLILCVYSKRGGGGLGASRESLKAYVPNVLPISMTDDLDILSNDHRWTLPRLAGECQCLYK